MNIAFFLTPKNEVIYEKITSTMRQALERMEYHRYTAIPILDDNGKYIGTLTEGDLLWKLKNTPEIDFQTTNKVSIKDIPRHMNNRPVHIDSDIEDLISKSVSQNFVPVVDDNNVFIGIIKRSDIMNYCYSEMFKNIKKEA
ncbi:CBS domain-containing protein [Clostridium acetobutylicum]|uniref:Two CBS domain containing protein n=1 Tax=Clostridium acetobutylicum (strain ATCC 824 / DSM 792 / JCM 1419 / IAM 19013 / LMG 5710 / NBRC 13948 / NRRL B-527 / VKM B-1787 / 2291 / W) TaxID=272562 RepID=Q97D09_CLOAB|nr:MULTISPECIES: CBS domain-containing protein [Clostridium]AAK81595.1 Two CBS domain containing protein [Clostridium acetobutylicum ATCC 824]ADZ22718.1 Two CBS domain containing protein [Clostridium acetobutylicum EA 2018]AEI32983.1 CBS domain-containing protein [Clostridium acetobutylicum DSM 1731]AWV80730.1 CBS domain-containing protein [Clostridium acetobutylicum]KHD35455.1 membrane protein [Clostridium acetobutylicum]